MTIARGRKAAGLILILTILLIMAVPGTAAAAPTGPDYVVSVTTQVESAGGALNFHMADDSGYNGPWYPGMAMKSVVRVKNGNYFTRVDVGNLGVWITAINDPDRFNTFAGKMNLIIKRGTFPDFTTTLYNGPLSGILYQAGSAQYTGKNVDISLGFLGQADLEYTLTMDENAGREMQNLTAALAFYINLNKIPPSDSGGGDSGGGDSGPPAPAALENWAHDCIEALIAEGILIPDANGDVRPDDNITRAETAELLARALKLQEQNGFLSGYLDPLPEATRGFIIAASKAGVFRGYPIIAEGLPGRVFRPNNSITREELTCVLVRAFNVKLEGDFELTFTDKADISDWALTDVKAGVQKKAIGGYPDNSFKPKNPMTRAEAFSLVCRLLGLHDKHQVQAAANQ